MNTLKFKTNLKCEGCKNAVRPFLNQIDAINSWEVDLSHKDKILTIEANTIGQDEIASQVKEAFNQAGYIAEKI
ncbi:MAG: heavy-metal-associated domain-containing protein [Bacteroidales bacterium]|jgi:copper chaperone|nr:heavy-metal-associated domain-containing protein [Bacteroidales bacterium]